MRQIPKSSLIVKMLFLTPPSPCPRQIHTQMEGSVARGENFSSRGSYATQGIIKQEINNLESGTDMKTGPLHPVFSGNQDLAVKSWPCQLGRDGYRACWNLASLPSPVHPSSFNKSPATSPFLVSHVLHPIVITDASWSSLAPTPLFLPSGPWSPLFLLPSSSASFTGKIKQNNKRMGNK